jgi:acetylornithine deacetylase/succinyl-diaminopimelate desuccinylase-like protein
VTGTALTGPENRSVFERTWALPTFEIHGIRGGFVGDGAKTVIPAYAVAKVSLRLVPGQRYEKVARQLERAVADLAPKWADVKVTAMHGGDPVQIPVDHPAFALLDEAFEEVVGRRTVSIRSGGSIPIIPELGLTGAPVILTGIGLPDDGLHSPNEKLDLAQLWSGIQVFGRFFELLAERGGEARVERDEEREAVETV